MCRGDHRRLSIDIPSVGTRSKPHGHLDRQSVESRIIFDRFKSADYRQTVEFRALKSHALSVRLTQTNSVLRSHAETIISHAFEIPCSFSEVPS